MSPLDVQSAVKFFNFMQNYLSRLGSGRICGLVFALVLCAELFVSTAHGQVGGRFGRTVPDVRPIDQQEARERLQEMQRLRPAGLNSVEFSIEHHPRRSPTRRFAGQLWLAGEADSVAARVRWQEGSETPLFDTLLRIGADPEVWWWGGADTGVVRATERLFEPVVSGSDLLFFDLLNPWFFWDGMEYIGSKRLSGSPLHLFEVVPPPRYREGLKRLGVASLIIGMDPRFNAPVRVEYVDAEGGVLRLLEVRRVRRVGEQWVVRTVEVVDQSSRSRTQFHVGAVALDLEWTETDRLFSPENLGTDPEYPASREFVDL